MTPQTQNPLKGANHLAAGQPEKANGTTMVTVACKLPNGIICEMGKFGDENYTRVALNGANSARVVGGYGLTPVSKEFWDAWVAKNRNLEFVRKGLVFAHNDNASAADEAKDRGEVRTGLEALNPFKDERIKGILGPDGKPLVEVDMNHFNQGRADVAQFGGARR